MVIPAFNAARTIGPVIRGVRRQGLEVVVVDDGSQDATAETASAAGAVVISLLANQGKGAALRAGFAHALRAGCDGVITMDSDGQHDPSDLARMVHAADWQHAGLVLGNRMANGDVMPRLRRWTNRAMSGLLSRLARQPIPDSQCGLRLIRREVLQDVRLRTSRFEIESELLLASAARRWKIVSVPVRTIYAREPSHIRPVWDTLRFLGLVLRVMVRR